MCYPVFRGLLVNVFSLARAAYLIMSKLFGFCELVFATLFVDATELVDDLPLSPERIHDVLLLRTKLSLSIILRLDRSSHLIKVGYFVDFARSSRLRLRLQFY